MTNCRDNRGINQINREEVSFPKRFFSSWISISRTIPLVLFAGEGRGGGGGCELGEEDEEAGEKPDEIRAGEGGRRRGRRLPNPYLTTINLMEIRQNLPKSQLAAWLPPRSAPWSRKGKIERVNKQIRLGFLPNAKKYFIQTPPGGLDRDRAPNFQMKVFAITLRKIPTRSAL